LRRLLEDRRRPLGWERVRVEADAREPVARGGEAERADRAVDDGGGHVPHYNARGQRGVRWCRMLAPLSTTVVGSYPQPAWLSDRDRLVRAPTARGAAA